MPMKYYLAPHRCENDGDGPDEPSCEKKESGIVRGDQWLRWERSRAVRVSEMKCDMCGHVARMDLIVTWHDAGLK